MAGGSFLSNTIVHAPPWRIASGMTSATSRRAASARSRHQPSGREPMTLLPATNVAEPGVGVTMVRMCGVDVAGASGKTRAGWPAPPNR